MILSPQGPKTDSRPMVNWVIDTTPQILERIHHKEVNIAIYERATHALTHEIDQLLAQNIEVKSNGTMDTVLQDLLNVIDPKVYPLIIQDIKALLDCFKTIVDVQKFRLLFATINNNMCRKFHVDINTVRMLCTYSGPGTLWLTNNNINRKALGACGDNACIVRDESNIQQAKTGAVVLLKGARYPYGATNAVVHRSPTIEETGKKRLLLRIDSN